MVIYPKDITAAVQKMLSPAENYELEPNRKFGRREARSKGLAPLSTVPNTNHQIRVVFKEYEVSCGEIDVVVKENVKLEGGVQISFRKRTKGSASWGKLDFATWMSLCKNMDVVATARNLILGRSGSDLALISPSAVELKNDNHCDPGAIGSVPETPLHICLSPCDDKKLADSNLDKCLAGNT